MKEIPTHLWRWLRRGAQLLPPTARGWLVACFSAAALWLYGFGTLDLILFVVGIAGLVLVVLSAVAVGATALYLRRSLATVASTVDRLEAGSPIRTGFRVPALAALPLVKVSWEWRVPEAVEVRVRPIGKDLVEEVVAGQRCQVTSLCRVFSVFDVFGLNRVSWERTDTAPLLVLPNVGRLRHLSVVQALDADEGRPHPAGAPEGDRMDIRRYVPGDSVRSILWKTFARTRQLNVRIAERSVDPARKIVAYLLTGEDDEPAAAAARVALETGALGPEWYFGADGTDAPVESLGPALQAIARSGSPVDGAHRPGLSDFLATATLSAGAGVHCLVFAPARAGAWTEEALRAARAHPGPLSFVVATDGVVRELRAPLWQRLLFAPEERAGTPAEAMSDVLGHLERAGCRTLVVDRTSGQSWSGAGLRQGSPEPVLRAAAGGAR